MTTRHPRLGRRAAVATVAAATAVAALGLGAAPASAATVTAVTGSAYGYYTNVSLFGGPFDPRGPAPTVTLPSSGGSASDSLPEAVAVYGPAELFRSGALTVTAEGSTGAAGSVTTTSHVVGYQDQVDTDPDGDGPGPFLYQDVRSSCTATPDGVTASTVIEGGIVETSTDPGTGDATSTVAVPTNPQAGLTVSGTLDHVGDRFRVVFNEQVVGANGTTTVNAAHIYLLGPTATGDVIIGQSVCGVVADRTADLSVAITDSPDPVTPRGTITYTVTVANAGPDAAPAVTFVTRAKGSKFVGATGAACTETKGKDAGISCDVGTLASGASRVVTIEVTAPGKAAPFTATATTSSTASDPDLSNNTASETTDVVR